MIRGEFHCANGEILPNNISLEGAKVILEAAFRNTPPTWWVGLVKGFPNPAMTLADMLEPTIGVNGYQRYQITRDATGWPVSSSAGNQQYIESDWITWTPVGGDFDMAITRVALFSTSVANPTNKILALSAAMPAERVIGQSTNLNDRRFKYRVFL